MMAGVFQPCVLTWEAQRGCSGSMVQWRKWSESAFATVLLRVFFQKYSPHGVSLWETGWQSVLQEASRIRRRMAFAQPSQKDSSAGPSKQPSCTVFVNILPFREWCEMRNSTDLHEESWRETCLFMSISQISIDLWVALQTQINIVV